MKLSPTSIKYLLLGSDDFARAVLARLHELGLPPAEVITKTDAPLPTDYDLVLVASFGKILTKDFLAAPRYGVLNIHPSLLPKYRGATPIQTAIANGDQETGVSLMLMDEKVDHGPILAAQKYELPADATFAQARDALAQLGAQVFANALPEWLAGTQKPQEQNHAQATCTKKLERDDGLVTLTDDPIMLDRKFRAYSPWPGTFFFAKNGKRVKIIAAHLADNQFIIDRVTPEGSRPMDWQSFLLGYKI